MSLHLANQVLSMFWCLRGQELIFSGNSRPRLIVARTFRPLLARLVGWRINEVIRHSSQEFQIRMENPFAIRPISSNDKNTELGLKR